MQPTLQQQQLKELNWKYRIMDLPAPELLKQIKQMSREHIISWLSWNDRNGVYTDEDSLLELGNVMSKEEGEEIMFRQIMRERENWDGYMGDKWIGE